MAKQTKRTVRQAKLPGLEPKAGPATDLMKMVALKAPVKNRIDKDFTKKEAAEIRQKLADKRAEKEAKWLDEHDESKLARREKAVKVKKLAREMEKGNKSRVILFPSYSRNGNDLEWYKMGNFSALYYVYRMADRMGRAGKIMRDSDKFAKMNAIASIRGIERFLELAMKLNEFRDYEVTLDGIYILHLKKEVTDDELGILKRTEEERREMMHNVLRPKRADTAVYQAILTMDRQVLPRVTKMPKGYYVTIGEVMARQILKMTQIYFEYAHGRMELTMMKENMNSLLDGVRAGVVLLGEIGVWGYDVASSIGENLETLRRAIDGAK